MDNTYIPDEYPYNAHNTYNQEILPEPQTLVDTPKINPEYVYNKSSFETDFTIVLRKIVRYLIEGLAVAFVAYLVLGKNKLNMRDVVILGVTAAFVFAILDAFSPMVATGVRFGAGFGIGQNLFGVGPLAKLGL